MKKHRGELILVVVVVAAVVGFTHSTRFKTAGSTAEPPVPLATAAPTAASTPGFSASPIGMPASGQTRQATVLWKALYDEAQAFLAQGDNDRAEAKLVAALKLAPMAGPEALHETLDDLGLVCYRLGEYQRCADYQERAVKAASQWASPESAATVGLYETRFAMGLQALDRRDQALAALGRAHQKFQEAYPAGSPAYSEAINNLAAQHRSMGDNDGAARLVEE